MQTAAVVACDRYFEERSYGEIDLKAEVLARYVIATRRGERRDSTLGNVIDCKWQVNFNLPLKAYVLRICLVHSILIR